MASLYICFIVSNNIIKKIYLEEDFDKTFNEGLGKFKICKNLILKITFFINV